MTVEELMAGIIPVELEEKSAAAAHLVRLARRIVPVTSLLIAAARRDNFRGDIAGWCGWCRETLDLDGADRDHRRAIGDMLLDLKENAAIFERLFALTFDKLLALTRIPAVQIPAFLSHHKVEELTREQVRDAVAEWLDETPKSRAATTPNLPGFDDALAAINALPSERIARYVTDDRSARHALTAGLGLVEASLSYHKAAKSGVEILQKLKVSLLYEVKELEEIISECCAQQSRQNNVVHNN